MTHSDGKPHAVGDRGQRFEITVHDDELKERRTLGWAETEYAAHQMGLAAVKRPSWRDYQVTDRHAGDQKP